MSGCKNKNEELAAVKVISDEKIKEYQETIREKDSALKKLEEEMKKFKIENEELLIKINVLEQELKEKRENGDQISIAGIRLGYTMAQVSEIIGKDYVVSDWTSIDERQNKKWLYGDKIEVLFLSDKVNSIKLKSPPNIYFRYL